MGRELTLEAFDLEGSGTPPAVPETPQLGYEDGYRTGHAAGLAEARAEQAALSEEIARSLAEIGLTQAEARESVINSLRSLFTAITETLLPAAARSSLAPYVVETLIEAAEEDSRAPIALLVAPEAVETIQAIAAAQARSPVTVDANAGLGAGEVLIRHADRETMLDLDRLVVEIQNALAALFAEDTRRTFHG